MKTLLKFLQANSRIIDMLKFEKKWALIGMAFCVLLNILSAIGVIPIGGLQRGSFGGATFFLIVYFVVKQQEGKK